MAENQVVFADGFSFREPREGAPEFIIGSISVRSADAIDFIKKHTNKNGYVNIDVKRSRAGKLYCQWNDYKFEPQDTRDAFEKAIDETKDPDDVPFV